MCIAEHFNAEIAARYGVTKLDAAQIQEAVRLLRGSDGRVAVTFVAVALDDLEGFVEAVREELLAAE